MRNEWVTLVQATHSVLRAPREIRTHTGQGLSLMPLPIGLERRVLRAQGGTRTHTEPGLSRCPLPLGYMRKANPVGRSLRLTLAAESTTQQEMHPLGAESYVRQAT